MLRLFVTIPAQRLEVGKLKAERRIILKRDDMVYLGCRCYLFFGQTFLTEIMITLQRLHSDAPPCRSMIEALLF